MNAFRSILSGTDRSITGHMARLGLACLEPLYSAAIFARNHLYDLGLSASSKLPRVTISVGNLTCGGTGKTPTVIELARRLGSMGAKPAVLLRGYKGKARGSDEAQELVFELGSSVPVEVNADRAAAAHRVVGAFPDVKVFVLDDAFQHRKVHRDLDVVLIDALQPFGFDHLLPRGLLREPISNLRRANAVMVTRSDLVHPEDQARLDQTITSITGQKPLAHAVHRWVGFRDPQDQKRPFDLLKQAKVIGICGIAQPCSFERMLKDHVDVIEQCVALSDHHAYRRDQVVRILSEAVDAGCEAAVTTEKDWVKWRNLVDIQSLPMPVYRPILKMTVLDGSDELDELLRRCIKQADGLSFKP